MRFSIARALVTDPRVILLDEPSQGLAPLVVEELTRLMPRLRDEGVSLLLVEHDMEVVFKLAHDITVLHRGRVIADGPPAAVRANAAVRSAYLGESE